VRTLAVLVSGLVALAAKAVFAQQYPSSPIRIITASAGGGSDFVSRLVAQGISEYQDQTL
jgi:tripartite-type tricarboxylate transporter receptor subunit TctC